MKPRLPSEYVYQSEVFPVFMIGIALNLAGSYLIDATKVAEVGHTPSWLSVTLLFQDTGGTAFVALAIGPWWAAAAGIISSMLNSFLDPNFGDAFAYATVNVGLALTWGYVGRIFCVEKVLIATKLSALGWRAFFATLALVLSGALAATVFSDFVKLALIEQAGGKLGQGQAIFAAIQQQIERFGPHGEAARILTLGFLDSYGNLLDKGLSVLVAIVLIHTFGVIPSSHIHGGGLVEPPLRQRMRVGADSIFIFTGVYTFYLVACRLLLDSVHFSGSPDQSGMQDWMQSLAAVLLLPFAMALIAFVFGTLSYRRRVDARVEKNRMQRADLYGEIRRKTPLSRSAIEKSEIYSVMQRNSIYGVTTSVVGWPAKNNLPGIYSVWVYFFAMIACSTVFFFERREAMQMFRKAIEWRDALRKKFAGRGDPGQANSLIPLFLDIASGDLTPAFSGLQYVDSISYQVAINTAKAGWFYELRDSKSLDHFLLIGMQGRDTFDATARKHMEKVIAQTGIKAVIILCRAVEPAQIPSLHKLYRFTRCRIILLEAANLQGLVKARARREDIGLVLARTHVESHFVPGLEA
jgi:hypothetical protein